MSRSYLWYPQPHRSYWHYLRLQFKTRHRSQTQLIVLIITIVTLLFMAGFMVIIRSSPTRELPVLGLQSPAVPLIYPPPSEPMISPQFTPVPASVTETAQIYSVDLSSNPEAATLAGLLLADALVGLFQLPLNVGEPYPIQLLVYDTQLFDPWSASGSGKFNARYYLQTALSFSLAPQIYQNQWFRAAVALVPPAQIPYLLNHSFCIQDTDCSIRHSYCDFGAFNRYDPFVDSYACTQPAAESALVFDPNQNCPGLAEYLPVRCQANRCIAQSVIRCLTPPPQI